MNLYIWVAHQSEPGMSGNRYCVTDNQNPPASIKPVPHHDQLTGNETGLAYDDTLYADWRLTGALSGELFINSYGEQMITITDDPNKGIVASVDEIIAFGWYQEAGNAQQQS